MLWTQAGSPGTTAPAPSPPPVQQILYGTPAWLVVLIALTATVLAVLVTWMLATAQARRRRRPRKE